MSGTEYTLPVSATNPVAINTEPGAPSASGSGTGPGPAQYTGKASGNKISFLAESSAFLVGVLQIMFLL